VRDRLKGWSKAECEPQARATEKERQPGVQSYECRSWFVSMDYRFKKLAQYIRGWINYFGISEYYRPVPELDHWLRRRVRMYYWKQWRY
jgi:hypothetical protein